MGWRGGRDNDYGNWDKKPPVSERQVSIASKAAGDARIVSLEQVTLRSKIIRRNMKVIQQQLQPTAAPPMRPSGEATSLSAAEPMQTSTNLYQFSDIEKLAALISHDL